MNNWHRMADTRGIVLDHLLGRGAFDYSHTLKNDPPLDVEGMGKFTIEGGQPAEVLRGPPWETVPSD